MCVWVLSECYIWIKNHVQWMSQIKTIITINNNNNNDINNNILCSIVARTARLNLSGIVLFD